MDEVLTRHEAGNRRLIRFANLGQAIGHRTNGRGKQNPFTHVDGRQISQLDGRREPSIPNPDTPGSLESWMNR